eukprot:1993167-Rhodomonas_salina.8
MAGCESSGSRSTSSSANMPSSPACRVIMPRRQCQEQPEVLGYSCRYPAAMALLVAGVYDATGTEIWC